MSENIYSAPSAKLVKEPEAQQPSFYVVAPRKFWLLLLVTFTTYMFYWFYKHWSNYKAHTKESLWPVPRAIFSLFFTHSLFQKIDNAIGLTENSYRWSPTGMATVFVFLVIANNVCSRLAEYEIGLPFTAIMQLISIPLVGWPLYRAQRAANVACADPKGLSNSRITVANWLWLIAFGIFWALLFAALWSIVSLNG